MLALPERGMARSIHTHRCDLIAVVEWLEASVLFGETPVSFPQVIDVLCENQIYESQDFAWGFLADVSAELQFRSRTLGDAYPFILEENRLSPATRWRDNAAYSFCLALSLAPLYPSWLKKFHKKGYNEQGAHFEALTHGALQLMFTGWVAHRTGWHTKQPAQLGALIGQLAGLLDEQIGQPQRWTKESAKDEGLDIVCFRPFADGRVGSVCILFQCASGKDWSGKLHTPNVEVWTKVIDFASAPLKGIAIPYQLTAEQMRHAVLRAKGMIIDRLRLLSPTKGKDNWPDKTLAASLVKWASPRVKKLPRLSA
jgi:hypothetical protein